MEYSTSKVFVIAVGIIVTVIIVSALMLVVNSVRNVYSTVGDTDISIATIYDDVKVQYDTGGKYDMNGISLINTLRKYETSSYVFVSLESHTAITTKDKTLEQRRAVIDGVSESMKSGGVGLGLTYENQYRAKVIENDNYIEIIFY